MVGEVRFPAQDPAGPSGSARHHRMFTWSWGPRDPPEYLRSPGALILASVEDVGAAGPAHGLNASRAPDQPGHSPVAATSVRADSEDGAPTTDMPGAGQTCHSSSARKGPPEGHEEEKRTQMNTMNHAGRAHVETENRQRAERELSAARSELASLDAAASPSRLERALERVEAAQAALALAA